MRFRFGHAHNTAMCNVQYTQIKAADKSKLRTSFIVKPAASCSNLFAKHCIPNSDRCSALQFFFWQCSVHVCMSALPLGDHWRTWHATFGCSCPLGMASVYCRIRSVGNCTPS